jgi:DNA polymerase-3 subunit beta
MNDLTTNNTNTIFSINNKVLRNAVALAASSMNKENAMSVLSFGLFHITDNKITINTTNKELYFKQTLPCYTQGDISVCLPINSTDSLNLQSVCKSKTQNVSGLINGKCFLTTDNVKQMELNTMKEEEFPCLQDIEYSNSVEIDSISLLDTIQKTVYAVSTPSKNEIRPGTLNLLFDSELSQFVCTDGHRLTVQRLNVISSSIETHRKMLIPLKTIQLLVRVLKGQNTNVLIQWHNSMMYIEFKVGTQYTIKSWLVDEVFPDYQQVIPQKKTGLAFISFDKDDMLNCLQSINNIAASKICIFKFHSNKIEISTENYNIYQSVKADCSTKAEGLRFGLNIKYFIDILKNSTFFRSVNCFKSADSTNPIAIETLGGICVLMPTKFQQDKSIEHHDVSEQVGSVFASQSLPLELEHNKD